MYPLSAEDRPRGAEIRTAGEWAHQLGGQVGGSSELNPYELGLANRELDKASKENAAEDEER